MPTKSNLIALIVACAFFMQSLDTTIVATALPQIAKSFDTTAVHLSMAITSYIVSIAVFIPISGWVADRFGGSTIFRAAIVIFSVSSIFCGVSQNVTELTIARIVQGLGGAMMVPVGRLIVLRASEKSEMVRALSMIAIPGMIGPVMGAPIGGFLTTYFSWRSIFFINIPIGVLGIILATLFIPNHRENERRRLDWFGFILTGVTLSFIMYGLEAFGKGTGSFSEIVGFLIIGVSVGIAAIWHARRHDAPILDLSLLRVPTFFMSTVGGMSSRIATGAMPFLLPLLFQVGFGKTAFSSGLLTFASSLGAMTMRTVAKPILSRFGFRNVLMQNSIFTALSILVCALFTPSTPALLIIAVLLAGGFFRALGNSTIFAMAYAEVDNPRMSAATSFSQLVNQFGNALGVATGATLLHLSLAWHGSAALDLGDFRFAFIGVAAIAVISFPIFARLSPDAGAELSGHHPRPAPKSNT